jgi:outer membrane receptor for ferrienterochelin and colicin
MSTFKLSLKNLFLLPIVFLSFAVTSQEVEEVVVTATKKAESTQDLALSIEAVTSESLDVNQVYDLSDLAEVIPGLETAKGIGSGSSFTIRGMGSFGIGAGVISAVVTSVNGHSVNESVLGDTGFFDLERIEVLKGPQGTLFGRNAANGVINLVTARLKLMSVLSLTCASVFKNDWDTWWVGVIVLVVEAVLCAVIFYYVWYTDTTMDVLTEEKEEKPVEKEEELSVELNADGEVHRSYCC